MNNDLLKSELKRDEGVRVKPYRDTVGKLTIGVGRNLDDVGISEAEADFLLETDIARAVASLDKNIPWWRALTDSRQRVLINMAFNMGIGSLLGFKNTLSMIQSGRYSEAADAMLESKWAKQVGDRANRLAEMMRIGD